MSVAGISSNLYLPASMQNSFQDRRAEFQQLGKDLQSGNLSAAQQDFATLTQNSTSQSASPGASSAAVSLKQAFGNLQTALSSGDVSGAQQAYSQIQQDFQSQGTQGHHHHHHGGGASPTQSTDSSTTDLINMLTVATNSNATSAYSSTDLLALLSSSPAIDAAA